ncbi:MAG: hypothetical protein PVF15_10140 [Candidatus Bathyarchaeota archaeon]
MEIKYSMRYKKIVWTLFWAIFALIAVMSFWLWFTGSDAPLLGILLALIVLTIFSLYLMYCVPTTRIRRG